MFMTFCKSVRNHGFFFWLGGGILGSLLGVVVISLFGGQWLFQENEWLMIILPIAVCLLSAIVCSWLIHCADADDYMKEHPSISKKTAWRVTEMPDNEELFM